MGYKIAIIGATGNVGHQLLEILSGHGLPLDEVFAIASRRSRGVEVSFGDKTLKCQDLEQFDFSRVDIALMSAGAALSKEWAPKIAARGCVVIDNSSAWRTDADVPLIVPEVNADAIAGFAKKNIIANPNCSTTQLVVALKPLHDAATIKRVVVATYQSVSGAGKAAMDELFTQTRGIYVNDPIVKEEFSKQIAFNVIPHIDDFMDDGNTREEWKMSVETRKILDPDIKVTATCVRVPVFIGHGEAINLELKNELSVRQAQTLLRSAPGVSVFDHRLDDGYITPAECAGEDAVYVSRVRKDPTVKHGLSLWVVSDNLRKGAALNAVQIAELLVKDYLGKKQAPKGSAAA